MRSGSNAGGRGPPPTKGLQRRHLSVQGGLMTTVPNNNQQLSILPALLEHFFTKGWGATAGSLRVGWAGGGGVGMDGILGWTYIELEWGDRHEGSFHRDASLICFLFQQFSRNEKIPSDINAAGMFPKSCPSFPHLCLPGAERLGPFFQGCFRWGVYIREIRDSSSVSCVLVMGG